MPLPDKWAELFLARRPTLRAPDGAGPKTWLSFSTVEYRMSRDLAQSLEVFDPALHEVDLAPFGPQTSAAHKALNAEFVRNLGYDDYVELDVNSMADIQWDMNLPVPEDLHHRADLLWDCGSLEHVMDTMQCLKNLLALTKPGGVIVHSQGVGDIMDHGYITVSPLLIHDYYAHNGCAVEEMLILDPDGYWYPYDPKWGQHTLARYLDWAQAHVGLPSHSGTPKAPFQRHPLSTYSLMAVVRKTPDSTVENAAVQGRFDV